MPKISTGDMLRDGIRDGNPVALAAKALMDMGGLVDDGTKIAIGTERLGRPAPGAPSPPPRRGRPGPPPPRRRPAERGAGLLQVVLQEPPLGERGADRELILTRQRAGTQQRRQQLRCFRATAAIESAHGPAENRLH